MKGGAPVSSLNDIGYTWQPALSDAFCSGDPGKLEYQAILGHPPSRGWFQDAHRRERRLRNSTVVSSMSPNQPAISPEVQQYPEALVYPGRGPASSKERFDLLNLENQGPGGRTPLTESSRSEEAAGRRRTGGRWQQAREGESLNVPKSGSRWWDLICGLGAPSSHHGSSSSWLHELPKSFLFPLPKTGSRDSA